MSVTIEVLGPLLKSLKWSGSRSVALVEDALIDSPIMRLEERTKILWAVDQAYSLFGGVAMGCAEFASNLHDQFGVGAVSPQWVYRAMRLLGHVDEDGVFVSDLATRFDEFIDFFKQADSRFSGLYALVKESEEPDAISMVTRRKRSGESRGSADHPVGHAELEEPDQQEEQSQEDQGGRYMRTPAQNWAEAQAGYHRDGMREVKCMLEHGWDPADVLSYVECDHHDKYCSWNYRDRESYRGGPNAHKHAAQTRRDQEWKRHALAAESHVERANDLKSSGVLSAPPPGAGPRPELMLADVKTGKQVTRAELSKF